MPHVSIEGPLVLEDLFSAFELRVERTPAGPRRVKNLYLSRRKNTLLLETLVVEGGVTRKFYLRVDAKGPNRHGIRIDPLVHVERTRGVQNALAWVARTIRDQIPGCSFGATNMAGLLDEA